MAPADFFCRNSCSTIRTCLSSTGTGTSSRKLSHCLLQTKYGLSSDDYQKRVHSRWVRAGSQKKSVYRESSFVIRPIFYAGVIIFGLEFVGCFHCMQ